MVRTFASTGANGESVDLMATDRRESQAPTARVRPGDEPHCAVPGRGEQETASSANRRARYGIVPMVFARFDARDAHQRGHRQRGKPRFPAVPIFGRRCGGKSLGCMSRREALAIAMIGPLFVNELLEAVSNAPTKQHAASGLHVACPVTLNGR